MGNNKDADVEIKYNTDTVRCRRKLVLVIRLDDDYS